MAKTLSYTDAVRILGGGPDSPTFKRLNNLTGGLLAGAVVAVPALIGLLDLRAELARVSGELATTLGREAAGSEHRNRSERLAAAHTVLVITAFFRAISDVDLSRARLTRDDQLRLAGTSSGGARDLTSAVLRTGLAVPEPHVPYDGYLRYLDTFYARLAENLGAFLSGLALWDHLTEGERSRLLAEIEAGGRSARTRYDEMLLDLMADCPDMALWLDRRHQAVVERRLDLMEPSLRELERLVGRVAADTAADGVAAALRRAHAALLEHRIVESADLPDGLRVPKLEDGYLPPAFQVAEEAGGRSAADEAFWRDVEVRDDIERFLAGYLGSPRAVRAPILVLGQPGAGKSVLTRVLAARLSTTRFLPIRVQLRDVDSSLPLQRQVEQAVLDATTEDTTWPALARSTDALPVIICDGFDELLQATGMTQPDFLLKVAEFQQRECEQGRAAAVLVTSRISVADRALVPPETMLLRLQPFDEGRIRRWVDMWNAVNATGQAARECAPLDAGEVLAHPDLAGQPLLLLMLALYDSDGNALRRGSAGRLTTGELYEQLLLGFARREVAKVYPNVSDRAREQLAEQELSRLAVVAFAMLNRSAQWVTEEAVDQDLKATLGEPAPGRIPQAGVDQLTPSELIFGRFFFIHRAQAVRGGTTRRSYEFLHATFGEYLVARFTWRLLADTVARDSVTITARSIGGNDLTAALLSTVALTVRASIVQFLAEMADRLSADERECWTDVLVRLFRQGERAGAWPFSAYQPVPTMNVAARFAAYSANLTLLATVASGGLRFGDLAEPGELDPARRWHNYALLWHAQLDDEGYGTFVNTFAVEECADAAGRRDVRLGLDRGSFALPSFDAHWRCDRLGEPRDQSILFTGLPVALQRRRAHFQAGQNEDLVLHSLRPLLEGGLGPTTRSFMPSTADLGVSAAHALLVVWLLPISETDRAGTIEAYERCARIAAGFPHWDSRLRDAYVDQLLAALAGHHDAPAAAALEVLGCLAASKLWSIGNWCRTAAVVLGRAEPGDPAAARIAELVLDVIEDERSSLQDGPSARAAVARAVAVRGAGRGTEIGPDGPGGAPIGSDSARIELEELWVRLRTLRTDVDRCGEGLRKLGDELSRHAGGLAELRAAEIAVGRTPEVIRGVGATLAYLDERLGSRLSTDPSPPPKIGGDAEPAP